MTVTNTGKNEGVANISAFATAYEPFAEWCDKRRMIKRTVLSDLMVWFVAQPDPVKTSILNIVDQGMEETYAQYLEQLAKHIRKRK